MLRCFAALLLVALWSPCAVSQSSTPKPDSAAAKLSKRVSNYNLRTFNLVGALIKVSNDFEIPMGISWIDSPAARAERSFAWKDATVLQVIKDIVAVQSGYRVDIGNGVLHVGPGAQIPDSQNFLALRVASFQAQDDFVEVAAFKLHMLLAPPAKNHQISIGGTGDSKVDLDLKDTSAAAALDALVVASNRKIWVVTFSSDPTFTNRGLRRVESLWGGTVVPDNEQPCWDLIRWKDPLPPLAVPPPAPPSQKIAPPPCRHFCSNNPRTIFHLTAFPPGTHG